MSVRQLGVVELGTDRFEESVKSGLWACEFSCEGKGRAVLNGDWLRDKVTLDLDDDGKLRAIVFAPTGDRKYELFLDGRVLSKGNLEVKVLDRSINRFSSTKFGGAALKNVASQIGSSSGAKQLQDGSVQFTYSDVTYAKHVTVHGNWNDADVQLEKSGGQWIGKAIIPPGKYTFRYRVDIGEALTAQAGPQSRLGWHAGTTTGKYLSTNLQELAISEWASPNSTSKPKQQVKPTTMASLAKAAHAVVRTQEVFQKEQPAQKSSLSVEEVAKAIEVAESRLPQKSPKLAPKLKTASHDAIASAQEIPDEPKSSSKRLLIAASIAVPVVVLVTLVILKPRVCGGDDPCEAKDLPSHDVKSNQNKSGNESSRRLGKTDNDYSKFRVGAGF
eukprot:CAMPEP_0184752520 /NCGR_PEP_ID=MMETSP0315-20130426/43620_1 /TAXON_ID=101924 /ORGANISM="Rhodosorus marinus, Strain UTEX LB 2760" /LENGTH=387 /DNA_ID=CAMNT_0027231855 /DNA_START=177 /DNA_END=1340 /DNA_ORIENTATION=+